MSTVQKISLDEGFYEVNWGGHEKKAPEITEEKVNTDSISAEEIP